MDNPLSHPVRPDLTAETNHRVANSLALLGGLVRMQARAAGKATQPYSNLEVRLMFDGIAARIATLGQLYRMLAHLPADGAFPLTSHLREVCSILVAAFSSDQQRIRVDHCGPECRVLTRYVQPLTLIVCEILTNAMKYAHPAGAPVHMAITCAPSAGGTLLITVSDDGVGLPEGFNVATDGGLGFQVIRALSSEIGATLTVLSDNLGVTFALRVPLALVANSETA